jgi:hypothetical protein
MVAELALAVTALATLVAPAGGPDDGQWTAVEEIAPAATG